MPVAATTTAPKHPPQHYYQDPPHFQYNGSFSSSASSMPPSATQPASSINNQLLHNDPSAQYPSQPAATPTNKTPSSSRKKQPPSSTYFSNVANLVCLFWYNDYPLLARAFHDAKIVDRHTRSSGSSPYATAAVAAAAAQASSSPPHSNYSTPASSATSSPTLGPLPKTPAAAATSLSTLVFSKWTLPTPAFRQFIHNVIRHTQLPVTAVSLALYYILRLKRHSLRPIVGNPNSEYRVFSVALMLANKFLDDNTYTNKTWAEVTHLPLKEISAMEVEFLANMRYSLVVSAEEWERWQASLRIWLNLHLSYCSPDSCVGSGSLGSSPSAVPLAIGPPSGNNNSPAAINTTPTTPATTTNSNNNPATVSQSPYSVSSSNPPRAQPHLYHQPHYPTLQPTPTSLTTTPRAKRPADSDSQQFFSTDAQQPPSKRIVLSTPPPSLPPLPSGPQQNLHQQLAAPGHSAHFNHPLPLSSLSTTPSFPPSSTSSTYIPQGIQQQPSLPLAPTQYTLPALSNSGAQVAYSNTQHLAPNTSLPSSNNNFASGSLVPKTTISASSSLASSSLALPSTSSISTPSSTTTIGPPSSILDQQAIQPGSGATTPSTSYGKIITATRLSSSPYAPVFPVRTLLIPTNSNSTYLSRSPAGPHPSQHPSSQQQKQSSVLPPTISSSSYTYNLTKPVHVSQNSTLAHQHAPVTPSSLGNGGPALSNSNATGNVGLGLNMGMGLGLGGGLGGLPPSGGGLQGSGGSPPPALGPVGVSPSSWLLPPPPHPPTNGHNSAAHPVQTVQAAAQAAAAAASQAMPPPGLSPGIMNGPANSMPLYYYSITDYKSRPQHHPPPTCGVVPLVTVTTQHQGHFDYVSCYNPTQAAAAGAPGSGTPVQGQTPVYDNVLYTQQHLSAPPPSSSSSSSSSATLQGPAGSIGRAAVTAAAQAKAAQAKAVAQEGILLGASPGGSGSSESCSTCPTSNNSSCGSTPQHLDLVMGGPTTTAMPAAAGNLMSQSLSAHPQGLPPQSQQAMMIHSVSTSPVEGPGRVSPLGPSPGLGLGATTPGILQPGVFFRTPLPPPPLHQYQSQLAQQYVHSNSGQQQNQAHHSAHTPPPPQ